MRFSWAKSFLIVLIFGLFLVGLGALPAQQPVFAQVPTVDIATVTSTPSGPIITVRGDAEQTQINVRSGPGTSYEKVGLLVVGQHAVAKGKSAGGLWLLIDYPGVPGGQAWVYSSLVDISAGSLPIVEPPPTPTPLVTMTIDPTMAAQFVVTSQATRLPTFTPPAPLAVPTYEVVSSSNATAGVPMGMIILGLAVLGIFVGLFSIAQGK